MPVDHNILSRIAGSDVKALKIAEESYGDSWKKRGGVDSFMMLARKWDRIEHQCEKQGFNILKACTEDTREEGIIDDIRDLRRYLVLVEHEMIERIQIGNPSKAYEEQEIACSPKPNKGMPPQAR